MSLEGRTYPDDAADAGAEDPYRLPRAGSRLRRAFQETLGHGARQFRRRDAALTLRPAQPLDRAGFIVFTNYGSRKAAEPMAGAAGALTGRMRAAAHRGSYRALPAAESDDYFAERARLSQLNAWSSDQSRPIASPEAMSARLATRTAEFAGCNSVPRPGHWGGYRLHLDAVEFWVEGADRFHERLRYERAQDGSWSSAWLQP
jgi:pyridoxamine 5'-phosphate oxidase